MLPGAARCELALQFYKRPDKQIVPDDGRPDFSAVNNRTRLPFPQNNTLAVPYIPHGKPKENRRSFRCIRDLQTDRIERGRNVLHNGICDMIPP